MKKKQPRPTFLRLQIADDAKTALERQAARHGMSQTELASRLVTWLVRQSSVLQASILNNIDAGDPNRLSTAAQMTARSAKKRTLAGKASDR